MASCTAKRDVQAVRWHASCSHQPLHRKDWLRVGWRRVWSAMAFQVELCFFHICFDDRGFDNRAMDLIFPYVDAAAWWVGSEDACRYSREEKELSEY